jgi:UDP-N-acetyl-D-mannosaminuronic acid dehydrogenase
MKAVFNKISVIGLGYIGLPTAAVLAARGLQVVGVDIDADTVATINNGKVHIVEPDLDLLVHQVVNSGHLRAVLQPEPADVFLITVPTPLTDTLGPDLSYINAAVKSIAPVLQTGNLVILESTSPVGTTGEISNALAVLRPDLTFPHQNSHYPDIHIAYCAERVMPGKILRELVENDRVIGGITSSCTQQAKMLYQTFINGECLLTDARTAEMTKLTENSFRDVNIAFANELSIICDKLNINVWELIKFANRHPRVNILQPGPGVGGHCIAVDPWFIVNSMPEHAKIIRAAREVNDSKPLFVLEKIMQAASEFNQPRIACLGIAYKPDTDDLRESPVIKILEELGAKTLFEVNIVEPNIKTLPPGLAAFTQLKLCGLKDALASADIVVLMVAHKEFQSVNTLDLSNKKFIDLVNIASLHVSFIPFEKTAVLV